MKNAVRTRTRLGGRGLGGEVDTSDPDDFDRARIRTLDKGREGFIVVTEPAAIFSDTSLVRRIDLALR